MGLLGIQPLAMLVPPATDTFHRERCRVMIDADVDKALVVDQVIHSIGYRLPIGKREVIVHIDAALFSYGLPLPPVVLESPDQILLLAIHRDDWIAYCFKLLALLFDMSKLGIPVLVASALNGFLVRPQREAAC